MFEFNQTFTRAVFGNGNYCAFAICLRPSASDTTDEYVGCLLILREYRSAFEDVLRMDGT